MKTRRGRPSRCRGCGARIDDSGDRLARFRVFCSSCSAGAAESVTRALAEDLPRIVVEVLKEEPCNATTSALNGDLVFCERPARHEGGHAGRTASSVLAWTPEPYEPPVVTPIGNLHDLLAMTCAGDHVDDEA